MRGPSPLSAGERELIYAYGSRAAGCHFCATSHRYCAIELGIPNDVFLLAPDQLDDAPLRAGLAALLRYTTSLVVNGHSGSAPRVGDFPIERFDRETLIDAILVAGLTAYINRVIEGLGAFSVDAQHSRNGEGLARFGYVRVREEVARSLHDAGLLADGAWRQSSAVIPAEMASRGALFRWLDSYRLLIFEGTSR
jgi:AhpD family alkylhydroperoxidase